MRCPKLCDVCCSSNIQFVNNSAAYGVERPVLNGWPYMWLCYDCRSSVYCHENTRFPLGFMADKATRALRIRFHKAFDPIWKQGLVQRQDAYHWLANNINVQPEECHAGTLSNDKLLEAIKFCERYLEENGNALVRRLKKRVLVQQKKDHDNNPIPEHEYQRIKRHIRKRRTR